MSEWKPKLKSGARFEGLNLTGEEGFVLSRLDGQTSLKDVVNVTGLPEGRVRQIVDKLVQHGAVDGGSAPAPVPGGASPAARRSRGGPSNAEELAAARAALLDDPSGESDLAHHENTMDDQPAVTEDGEPPPVGPEPIVPAANLQGVEEAQIDAPAEPEPAQGASGEGRGDDEAPPAETSAEGDKADQEEGETEQANYRQIYETQLSKLELPEREAMAKSAKDPQLSALCFDAHPSVIKYIFENNAAGFQHARLVARHHRTPQGLDVVLNRAEFFRDTSTQRLMLANTMLQDVQLRKLLGNKRLAEIYKTTLNRDIPERNRQKARGILRTKWATAEGEERAGLIFNTEGRCLMQLSGLPFDSQTSSLLCSKTYNSTLLIQNLARFSATPPNVLMHLSKQAVVRRQAHLRTLIMQHPNCPSEVKRKT